MPVAKKSAAPDGPLELYEKLIALNPDIERKGASHPYASVNGHMFSCLHPSGELALRLPSPEREQFLKRYKTNLFQVHGIVQKEYVAVPERLLKNTKELQTYFEMSHRYVQTLQPKPSKKKS